MIRLSMGKLRGLGQCASSRGTFSCLALDHRQGLRWAMKPGAPESVSDAELTDIKLDLCKQLAGEATAVLLDPQYSAAQAIAEKVIPKGVGLVVALESTGYTGDPTARQSRVLPGWSVSKAKRMGADMVKLLVYYHPDAPISGEIEAFVSKVAAQCSEHDLGLMLEPLSYSLDPSGMALPSIERRHVVTETARRLVVPGVDLLKVEFPLDPTTDPEESTWSAACAEVSAVSSAPWILLSAAVDFQTYLQQVKVACQAGASGVAVGRAVWKEAIGMRPIERLDFLSTTARERLERLNALCNALAKPWSDFYNPVETGSEWYRDY